MTRKDRELIDELAILNRDMVPLAVGIMEGTAGAAEQATYGDRLIAAGKRLQCRVNQMAGTNGPLTFPEHTVESHCEP